MTETAETGTALALFPKLNLPSVTGITEEMNKSFGTMYTRIEAGIRELPTDMTVKANREKVASYAYSISRTKTGLDEAAAGVSGDAKLIVDAVNAERRQLKTTLDKLRDKAREKLDAWEAAEKARRDKAEEAINHFRSADFVHADEDSSGLAVIIDNMRNWEFKAEHYGDLADVVREESEKAIDRLTKRMNEEAQREAEAAELEQLRREKAEREAKEAAEREKKERAEKEAAAEAERKAEEERRRIAQEEAAAKAAEDARIAAEKEAAEKIETAKREAAAAEQRAKEAEEREAKRIEDERRAAIEAEEAKKEAAARAEEDAKRREEKAKQDERDRIERERIAKERADQERAADEAHRRKINTEAVAAMMKAFEINETFAKQMVVAIYKGQIPHVTISY